MLCFSGARTLVSLWYQGFGEVGCTRHGDYIGHQDKCMIWWHHECSLLNTKLFICSHTPNTFIFVQCTSLISFTNLFLFICCLIFFLDPFSVINLVHLHIYIESGIFFTETSDYFSEILWSSYRPCSQFRNTRFNSQVRHFVDTLYFC